MPEKQWWDAPWMDYKVVVWMGIVGRRIVGRHTGDFRLYLQFQILVIKCKSNNLIFESENEKGVFFFFFLMFGDMLIFLTGQNRKRNAQNKLLLVLRQKIK